MDRTSPHILPLENRTLLSVAWDVSVNDPGDAFIEYHPRLISFTQAAGTDWTKLLNADPDASIQVQINLVNTISTANAASVTTVHTGESGGLDVFEQGVAAELRTGVDPNGAAVDAIINLSTDHLTTELYFDPGNPASRNGTVPGNQTDAYSTLLHEIGHVILWNGFRDYTTGALPADYQSSFDVHVQSMIGSFFFTGPEAQTVSGGPVPLTADNLYHIGNEDPLPGSDLLGELMNGVVFAFGAKYDFSPLDVAIARDAGLSVRSTPPTVGSQTFDYLGKPSVSWAFDAPVRWELSLDDITLIRTDTSATIPSGDLRLTYDRGTDIAALNYLPDSGVLTDGNYRVTLDNALVRDLANNQLDQSYELEFFVFSGDANHDRLVDTVDFNALAGHFGQAGVNFADGDFDYSGVVESADFNRLAGNYGKRLVESSPLPRASQSPFSESPLPESPFHAWSEDAPSVVL